MVLPAFAVVAVDFAVAVRFVTKLSAAELQRKLSESQVIGLINAYSVMDAQQQLRFVVIYWCLQQASSAAEENFEQITAMTAIVGNHRSNYT